MQMENFEIKKAPRKKKVVEETPVIVVEEKPKKERAPRKKIEPVVGMEQDDSVLITREKRPRRSKITSSEGLDLVPRDKREDMIREDSPVPENLPIEPFEEAITDIDDLSLRDLVQESSRSRALREQFGTDNESEIAQMLDQQVATNQATVEVIPTGPSELQDPVIVKPIRRWPETTQVIAPKERTRGFVNRVRNWFDRLIDSADDLDEE